METIYKSSDGKEFTSRRRCNSYEDALTEVKYIDELQTETVGGELYYKINTEAELYYFDHKDGNSSKTLYDIFCDLEDSNFRFPIWIHESGQKTKKSQVTELESKISQLKEEINRYKDDIETLKSLNSRSKTPVVDMEDLPDEPVENNLDPTDEEQDTTEDKPQQEPKNEPMQNTPVVNNKNQGSPSSTAQSEIERIKQGDFID